MDITIELLTQAYWSLSMLPLEGDPFTFERESDGLLIYHAAFDGELSMEFVLEDAAVWNEDLAERLAEALENVVSERHDPTQTP